jgi:UDP-N-acetylglucosamine 4,6-dehydratase/5-epimerase
MKTRPPLHAAARLIHHSIILITGGTGSFGKTITKTLLSYNPKEIRIFSRSEDKQDRMRYDFGEDARLRYILGDVRDPDSIKRAIDSVSYIFHAAAQKQVPASEYNVLEAIKTNVLGAQNVIDAARSAGVKKVIAISTDKAVEPVNAMGMSKALQEKLFTSAGVQPSKAPTIFACVRYGNVANSTGSVLPLFARQIEEGKPITVTDPEMTRFILTLEEAATLVCTALAEAKGGEIFVPDIAAHTIGDLTASIRTITKKIHHPIRITGVRVGEKKHETLITPTESGRTIKKKGYYVIYPEITRAFGSNKKIMRISRFSSDTARRLSQDQLIRLIKSAGIL